MMIKRVYLSILFILAIVCVNTLSAENPIKIAYINSLELLEAVPGKIAATNSINELNQKYKDELAIMQNDYNNKYTDFLANQNKLAESIKLRRMQELHELELNITQFMKVAQEDVESQEQQLIIPLKEKLKSAIEQIGIEQDFTCIYDLADPSLAFLTPKAIDANQLVKIELQKRR